MGNGGVTPPLTEEEEAGPFEEERGHRRRRSRSFGAGPEVWLPRDGRKNPDTRLPCATAPLYGKGARIGRAEVEALRQVGLG